MNAKLMGVLSFLMVAIGLLPSAQAATPTQHTDIVVTFGARTVRFSWWSDDGAFQGIGAMGCQVQDGAGYFLCVGSYLELHQAIENADGSTTYDFTLRGYYGTPRAFEVFGPNAILSVGRTPPLDFSLHLSWTHALASRGSPEGVSSEPVLVLDGSCIGSLCTHGTPFGIGLAVIKPKAVFDTLDQLTGPVFEVLECVETTC